MLRAILFDFNGVLVDDEPIHFELFQQVLHEEGIALTSEEYYASYLGFDDRGCFNAAFDSADRPLEPEALSRLIVRKAAYYEERIRQQGFPFFPGAVELIEEVAAAGLPLGVVSGALRSEVVGALEKLGMRERFKAVVAADDVAESKPHPESYARGLELLNTLPPRPRPRLEPREVLAIEDSPDGLRSAVANGLATLGVAQTYPAEKLTQADHVIPNLAGATWPGIRGLFT